FLQKGGKFVERSYPMVRLVTSGGRVSGVAAGEHAHGVGADTVERNKILGGIVPNVDHIFPCRALAGADQLEAAQRGLGRGPTVAVCQVAVLESIRDAERRHLPRLDDLMSVGDQI